MDNQLLKRRIIGAAVLVGLAVIFIPMILSGGRDEMPLFGSNIPEKPRAIKKLRSIEIPKPVELEAPAEVRLPVSERLPPAKAEKATTRKAGKATTPDQKVTPGILSGKQKSAASRAWAVQVGSFSQRKNALALQKKLRSKKFPAFVEYVKNNKGGVYRVRIGPEVKRDKAEAILQDVRKKLAIKGVVVSHP